MKIAILGYAHPFGEGCYYGAEREIWYLIQEFKKKGHECVVFSVGGCNLPGFEYIQIPIPWSDNKDLYLEAVKDYEGKNGKFDYIHSYMASGFISHEIREDWNYSLEPYFSFGRFYENVIAYSKKLNSLNANQSTVIYYGIPDRPLPEEAKDYVVWTGRMDMGKAPDIAIDFAKRAGVKLVLMGPAYHYPYSQDKIFPHVDNKNIIWLRAVDDEIKFKVLKNAKAFISTNWDRYHEMFGIVNIEALACGVPIIGWGKKDEPSAMNFEGGEIISHGVHGFINEYDTYSEQDRELSIDKALDFYKQIDNIDRMACYNLFKDRFTSEIMANNHLKYFQKVIERGKVYNITGEL
jgi:glycosyltransferase involved in cell wall biosynthesis